MIAEELGIAVRPLHTGQLDGAPIVSTHDYPQPTPQEWECGCVTGAFITDRDALAGEEPFEMRLAEPCRNPSCEVKEAIAAHERT